MRLTLAELWSYLLPKFDLDFDNDEKRNAA